MSVIKSTEFANQVSLTLPRVHQLMKNGVIQGEKIGRDVWIDEKFISVVKSRPERRGLSRAKKYEVTK